MVQLCCALCLCVCLCGSNITHKEPHHRNIEYTTQTSTSAQHIISANNSCCVFRFFSVVWESSTSRVEKYYYWNWNTRIVHTAAPTPSPVAAAAAIAATAAASVTVETIPERAKNTKQRNLNPQSIVCHSTAKRSTFRLDSLSNLQFTVCFPVDHHSVIQPPRQREIVHWRIQRQARHFNLNQHRNSRFCRVINRTEAQEEANKDGNRSIRQKSSKSYRHITTFTTHTNEVSSYIILIIIERTYRIVRLSSSSSLTSSSSPSCRLIERITIMLRFHTTALLRWTTTAQFFTVQWIVRTFRIN